MATFRLFVTGAGSAIPMDWVQDRLTEWSNWARSNSLGHNQQHPLASMMRVAAGEVPGRDLTIPYELTTSVEITEKAIARLKRENRLYKRFIMRYWLGRVPIFEIAVESKMSDIRAKEILHRAEYAVGRHILALEALTNGQNDPRMARVL